MNGCCASLGLCRISYKRNRITIFVFVYFTASRTSNTGPLLLFASETLLLGITFIYVYIALYRFLFPFLFHFPQPMPFQWALCERMLFVSFFVAIIHSWYCLSAHTFLLFYVGVFYVYLSLWMFLLVPLPLSVLSFCFDKMPCYHYTLLFMIIFWLLCILSSVQRRLEVCKHSVHHFKQVCIILYITLSTINWYKLSFWV